MNAAAKLVSNARRGVRPSRLSVCGGWPMALLFQDTEFLEKLRQLGEPVRTGGSFPKVVLVLVGLLGVLVLAYFLGKLQEILRKPMVHNEPLDLYTDLLRRLRLSRPDRRLMRQLARDLGLPHPTVLLISESLFDRYVLQWQKSRHRGGEAGSGAVTEDKWSGIRAKLFPVG